METQSITLAVKIPRELAEAIKTAEKKSGANRSELIREAITIGLREAVTQRLELRKKTSAMLAVA